MTRSRDLTASADGAFLAGTLHVPAVWAGRPLPAILMIGGSGPTTRDNDTYFPRIRARLLDVGLVVASFDKRGVGGSTGDLFDTSIDVQARDAAAALACVRAQPEVDPGRLGIFGHSQGGWVVLEVAADDPTLAFAITNSGPAVSPYRQERYALETGMRAAGAEEAAVVAALGRFDAVCEGIRSGVPLADLSRRMAGADPAEPSLVPPDEDVLRLTRSLLDHEPRPALERIAVPLLAIFGTDDRVVPVEASLRVLREVRAGRPGGLDELLIAGGDHRCQVGPDRELPEAYHAGLSRWILARVG